KPSATQPTPAQRVDDCWTTTTTQAAAVAQPPKTAKRGHSTPRKRRFGRALNSSSSPGLRTRSAITAACATVNESIAPNEYIVPRKSTFPGRMTRIEKNPAKVISASHGVLNRG